MSINYNPITKTYILDGNGSRCCTVVDDLGADSLDVVELLSQLEDEFGIIIPDDEVENLVTVADVAAQLEKLVK